MASTPPPAAPRRADHIRNRTALLKAAREVFTEQGPDAPISDVVRRAGFAKGTFFRHFATKEALVQALLIDRLTALGQVARDVNNTHPAGWNALSVMMHRFLDHLASDTSLAEFLDRGDVPPTQEIQDARRALTEQIDYALSGSQACGEVRPDVSGTDFGSIVLMISRTTGGRYLSQPRLGHRYLRLFLDGVRPGITTHLGTPPLTPSDLDLTQRLPITSPDLPKAAEH